MNHHLPRSLIALIGLFVFFTVIVSPSSVHSDATARPHAPLHFVDQSGAPLNLAALRLLCYDSATASAPTHDLLAQTDGKGQLTLALPADCGYLAALRIIHRQPAGKAGRENAYIVYETSWQMGSRAILPASGDITIHGDSRLVLFDVAIALEWEAAESSPINSQLRAGLLAASAYLYDLSDGQMAFGGLEITNGGRHWDSADIRLRAANDARPSARIGGIVGQSTLHTTTTGIQTIYAPGEILTGRSWDGDSPASGDWSQSAAYRTLVHEWLHYALFLYDEYQQVDLRGRHETYCTCNDLPQLFQDPTLCNIAMELTASAMAYHYSASELWHSGLPASCAETDQQLVHGGSDWETLARWSAIQGLPSEWLHQPQALQNGPQLGLVADLFGRQASQSAQQIYLPLVNRGGQGDQNRKIAALSQTSDITVTLLISGGNLDLAALNQFQVQVYAIHPTTANAPMRILHQGTLEGDRLPPNQLGNVQLLGVQAGDRLVVSGERYVRKGEPYASLIFDGLLGAQQSAITLTSNLWHASLDVTPALHEGRLDTLTVTVSSAISLPISATVQLCSPDIEIGCESGWLGTLQPQPNNSWQTVLHASNNQELPHFGYLWVEAAGVGSIFRWFQAAGGVGPAHMFGEAPLRDGLLMVDSNKLMSGTNNAVLIMPADLQPALQAPLPPGSNGLIGAPLAIKVITPNQPPALVTTLFYAKDQLDRLGLSDQNTQLLRYDSINNRWLPMAGVQSSDALGWIASPPQSEPGILAIAWTQQPNVGKFPALLVDPGPALEGEVVRSIIVLPVSPDAPISATGSISFPLPLRLTLLNPPICTSGECYYDEPTRTIFWQGAMTAAGGVALSVESILQNSMTCNPQLPQMAMVFDGVQTQTLNAITQVNCVPPATATPTSNPIPTATATPLGCEGVARDSIMATPVCTLLW